MFACIINMQCSATSPTSTGPTHAAVDLIGHYHGCPRQANHLVTFKTYLEFSRNHIFFLPDNLLGSYRIYVSVSTIFL